MKGPLKLSLAIALALSGADVWALGLGAIQIKSGLNQPLDAEIPIIAESPAELAGLHVDMATAEDFQRVGLNRARVNVPIEFAVSSNARGQTVIKVTTKDIVREPFVDFLIEVNWAKGKLLREYTVLLDPPISAPGKTAVATPAPEAAPAKTRPLPEKAPPAKPSPPPAVAKAPKAAPPAEQPKTAAAPPPKPTPAPAAHQATAGEYGPVAEGETLSQIAQATLPDDKTNVNRMMLALLKANPNAFFKDNINALKRGAILRIPSSDEIKATGSMADVVASVHSQNEAWTSGNVPTSTPTIVAHAGAKDDTKPAPTPAKTPDKAVVSTPPKQEHLALVPPRAGSGSQTTSDRAGASSGSSKDSADAKAELQRTKEALTSREQEVAEMKSRVKQLEDISGKDQRLISLKDSEIADLQAKLKALQAKSPATTTSTTTTPATTTTSTPLATTTPSTAMTAKPADTTAKPSETTSTATKTEPKITAQDIWGDSSKNAAATKTTPSSTTTTTPTSTTPTPMSSTTPSTTAPPVTTTTTTSPSTTTPVTTTPSTSEPTTPKDTSATTNPATSSTSTATPPTSSTPTPPAATPVPVKSPTPAKVTPIEPAVQPWYQNQMLLLGGGGLLLVVGLLALMSFMRKPKAALVPVGEADMLALDTEHDAAASEEEHRLLDELSADPGNTAVSLELLRIYYAHGDVAKFEATAEAMHANVHDLGGTEWQEAMAMGAVLVPHNPLFSGAADFGHEHLSDHDATMFGTQHVEPLHDDFAHATKQSAALDDNFDFDLPAHTPAPAATPAHDDLSFDLPPPTPAVVAATVPAPKPTIVPAPAPAAAPKADEFFVGEDAIGTKLDLAKAYLDMGDPEGARSMLDEVLTEGNEAQKSEARKLLAEIK